MARPVGLLPPKPGGAILGVETGHYAVAAAGISGLNSCADWESLDCNFYRITIETIHEKNKTSLNTISVSFRGKKKEEGKENNCFPKAGLIHSKLYLSLAACSGNEVMGSVERNMARCRVSTLH